MALDHRIFVVAAEVLGQLLAQIDGNRYNLPKETSSASLKSFQGSFPSAAPEVSSNLYGDLIFLSSLFCHICLNVELT